MMQIIIGMGIAAILMVVEYLLCVKLKNPLWGGIIPLAVLAGTILFFIIATIQLSVKSLFPFILLNSFMFGDWATGREKYRQKQKLELDKMRAHDLER